MKKSKLLQTLQHLSPQELKSFREYVASPYFNKNKKVLPLLAYLQKSLETEKDEAFNKEQVFKKVYPDRNFDEVYLRKQGSILYQLLKGFLSQENYTRDSFSKGKALLQELAARKLNRLFEIEHHRLKQSLEGNNKLDSHYFYQQFLISTEADSYFNRQQNRRFDVSLQEKVNQLDTYYFIEKLKGACEMLNRQKIVSGSYELHLIEEISSFLAQSSLFSKIPILEIYLNILKTLQEEENTQHFENLVSLLAKNQHAFPKHEAVAMYRYAQNYCIRQINKGEKQYFRKLFKLFQTQLNNKINLKDGILASEDYKNIVTVGLKIKEAEWVKKFIFDYKSVLSPAIRENVFNYNLASYYYGTKDYDAAIQLLSTIRYTDIYYEISGKIILAKTYFIKGENEALYYLIEAFKLNLQRSKKVAAQYRLSIRNFLIQLKKISSLKTKKNYLNKKEYTLKSQKLVQRIQVLSPLIDKPWLLAQLNTTLDKG